MITVTVGIIMNDGRVLLCQRKRSSRYGLKWEFPGGKLEHKEPMEECLKRELHEELGIRADIGSLFHRQHYVYPDSGSYDVFYYLVRRYSGEISNPAFGGAFAQLQWVPIGKLSSYDILEGNREAVQKLIEHYGKI
ncbi:MAG: (deoxy)nucleoside triphosphate pyrophosphohydrolase [Ignavibacteriae bacterium]|nr:(deoxy)nucleoside triphosphate pyrophosphohydrolase [Ignavibacteriota bacterium]